MTIPESQLEVWSHQGAVATAKATHEAVRSTLNSLLARASECEFYLQGSYANDTNIRGDSDVDLVVQINSIFRSDVSELTEAEQLTYKSAYEDATYTWANFRADAIAALRTRFGHDAVQEGKKSVKILAALGRLPADVVVCIEYRRYRRFRSVYDQDYISGMTFYVPSEYRWIINYPKLHYDNGVKKNSAPATNGWYKPAVRMFKNARTYLVNKNIIVKESAPSYFLECLLYNAPNYLYQKSYQDVYCNVVNWLADADFSQFVCRNEQQWLFGSTPEHWSVDRAKTFANALVQFWNKWGSL